VLDAAGQNNIHVGHTEFKFNGDGTINAFGKGNPADPNEEAPKLYPGTAMVFPIGGNTLPGDTVIEENKSRIKLNLPGTSRSAKLLRISLRQRDGSVYRGSVAAPFPMDSVRLYLELYL